MIRKLFYISAFALMAVTSPVMAQEDVDTKTLSDFAPGLLLSTEQKMSLDPSKIEDRIFASSSYASAAMDPEELYRLYDQGDYNRTVYGLLRLARQGDARAEETIGLMYRFGQGLKADNENALRWFTRAAADQRPLSQHHLGSMYFAGQGTQRDMVEAAKWMQLASENYPEGSKRDQALSDLKNISLRMSRIEQIEARKRAKQYVEENPPRQQQP